ncbi:MAG: leucine-rich repeat domain-containing protein, partial [Gammaproteobacteria bacterium]|nr:leucine-rich repeat domain-containing protein [Gammaproteobacteria bacterium]
GTGVFSGCLALTSVVIPSTVTSIGFRAFDDCRALTSVVISEGVTSIGESAFKGCSALTSVEIPEGVTSIGESAFKGCSALTSVVISEGVTSIGKSAFNDCINIEQIIVANRKDAENQLPRKLHEKIITKAEHVAERITQSITSNWDRPEDLLAFISRMPGFFNEMSEKQIFKIQNHLLELARRMTSDQRKMLLLNKQMISTDPGQNGLKELFDKSAGWFLWGKSPFEKMTELLKNATTFSAATAFFSPSGAGSDSSVEMTTVHSPSGK